MASLTHEETSRILRQFKEEEIDEATALSRLGLRDYDALVELMDHYGLLYTMEDLEQDMVTIRRQSAERKRRVHP